MFLLLLGVVSACAIAHFFVGNMLWPVGSLDSAKTTPIETSEPAVNLLNAFPSFRGAERTLDL